MLVQGRLVYSGKAICLYLVKLSIKIFWDPAVLFLDMHLEDVLTQSLTDTYRVFTAGLFAVVDRWRPIDSDRCYTEHQSTGSSAYSITCTDVKYVLKEDKIERYNTPLNEENLSQNQYLFFKNTHRGWRYGSSGKVLALKV